jgi:glucose-6-phosphate isomerase
MSGHQGEGRAADHVAYRHSLAGCLDGVIGVHGLTASDVQRLCARLEPALHDLKAAYHARSLPLLRIAEDEADIVAAEGALQRLSDGARTIVFFGTGGSSLGGQTLAQLAGWNIPGSGDGKQRGRPRTRFYDNLDAETLAAALESLDLASTRFVITSKSGGTVETLVQTIATLSAMKAAGLSHRIPYAFLGLTEPTQVGKSNGLRELLAGHGIPVLEHHTGIGGRFSVLSNVGLLPALARGLDVRAIRSGARSIVQAMLAARKPDDCAPALAAAVTIGLREAKGISTHVMMPYADRLGRFSHWFVQLWAESLGKSGKGTSPIACLGPLDQHSQLQLFMDGPREHLITIIRIATAPSGPLLDPELCRRAGIGFLAGRGAGDLVAAQAEAVPAALARAGRPVRTIDVPQLDAFAMGALLMHFMLETIFAARLLGIDAFDQPAVELAKVLARDALAAKN